MKIIVETKALVREIEQALEKMTATTRIQPTLPMNAESRVRKKKEGSLALVQ